MKNRKLGMIILAGSTAAMSVMPMAVFAEEESAAEDKFVLEYPDDMQAMGFTEPVVLDEIPERVVSLSAAPVLALYNLGVNLVGIPNSSVVTWPEELTEISGNVSFSVMSSDDFDYESVVALEPDLVFLASNGAETAGKTLESLGIPVYYVSAGHMVSYESIVMQTNALIDAFGVDKDSIAAGEAMRQSFEDVEINLETAKEAFGEKTVMVLQSGGGSHYIQTAGGTLGSMADMIGLKNVFENEGSSMVQLDYEQALDYNPDLVLCVGGTDAETHKETMEAAFAENEAYWNAIPAISDNNVIYLDVTYCSTAGINIVDNINHLIEIVADFYGIEVELQGVSEKDDETEISSEESSSEEASESETKEA